MTETLAGVSPSNTEELLEQPSLAEAGVAGAVGLEDTDEVDDPGGHGSGNSRNGTRSKTVLTDNVGP